MSYYTRTRGDILEAEGEMSLVGRGVLQHQVLSWYEENKILQLRDNSRVWVTIKDALSLCDLATNYIIRICS